MQLLPVPAQPIIVFEIYEYQLLPHLYLQLHRLRTGEIDCLQEKKIGIPIAVHGEGGHLQEGGEGDLALGQGGHLQGEHGGQHVRVHARFGILVMENILPVGVFRGLWDGALSLDPVLDLVDHPLVDDRLELPGEEELPRLRPLQLRPVVRQEVIRAAPAPEQHHYYDNEDNWVDNGDPGKFGSKQ